MKEIPGFNAPSSNQGSSRKNSSRLLDIPGIGEPAPECGNQSAEKSSFIKDAILGASGVLQPNETLINIRHEEKESAIQRREEQKARKRLRKETNKKIKKEAKLEKKKNKQNLAVALIKLLIGASTGDPVATATGAADTARNSKKTSKKGQKRQEKAIEGKWREIEAKQLEGGNKS